jgi:hypothetical protein
MFLLRTKCTNWGLVGNNLKYPLTITGNVEREYLLCVCLWGVVCGGFVLYGVFVCGVLVVCDVFVCVCVCLFVCVVCVWCVGGVCVCGVCVCGV